MKLGYIWGDSSLCIFREMRVSPSKYSLGGVNPGSGASWESSLLTRQLWIPSVAYCGSSEATEKLKWHSDCWENAALLSPTESEDPSQSLSTHLCWDQYL